MGLGDRVFTLLAPLAPVKIKSLCLLQLAEVLPILKQPRLEIELPAGIGMGEDDLPRSLLPRTTF
jgi:hypothetical protein